MNQRVITFVLRAFMFIVILLSMHNIISLVKNSQTYKHHSINIDKTLNIPFIIDLSYSSTDVPEYNQAQIVFDNNNTITSNKITIKLPDVDNDPYFLTMLFM